MIEKLPPSTSYRMRAITNKINEMIDVLNLGPDPVPLPPEPSEPMEEIIPFQFGDLIAPVDDPDGLVLCFSCENYVFAETTTKMKVEDTEVQVCTDCNAAFTDLGEYTGLAE